MTDKFDVISGEVDEVSIGGGMFRLKVEAVASRELRPWERHGPTQYWYTLEDFHLSLPRRSDNVTLYLRPNTTTVVKMEVHEKPKRVRKPKKEAA